MAIATVTGTAPEGANEAVTKWVDDEQWEALDEQLSVGVWRRLAGVNRALYASNHIAGMLVRDARGKAYAHDIDTVTYDGLDAMDVEALGLALVELGARAETLLAEVRENDHGCCGTAKADKAA